MSPFNPFRDFAFGELFETILPDFVLAFAFFTSLIYAILGKRFGQGRPAVTMSAALGFALSIGVVTWEQYNDMSIRNLGPVAVGFAIIMLALVMYQAIKQMGGSWAGGGIAIGASLIVAWVLGADWPIDAEIVQTVIGVTLTVGVLAFLLHRKGSFTPLPTPKGERSDIRHDMRDLYDDQKVSRKLKKGLHHARKEARTLNEHPEDAGDVMLQLKRMLPAEGWLTERMARLRAKAHQIRNGHIARVEETRDAFSKLPASAKKKAAAELTARYDQMAGIDERLERLDKAVAENERRIRDITKASEEALAAGDYPKLHDLLKAAEKLQKHNSRLFKLIDRSESRLSTAAKHVAKGTQEVNKT